MSGEVFPMKKDSGNERVDSYMIGWTNNNGFTLVEVLIALTILFIISSAFLALFVNSYEGITTSGMKNKELYQIQEKLEQAIASGDSFEEKELIISFPDIEQPIKVLGSIQREKVIIGDKKLAISVFIPR